MTLREAAQQALEALEPDCELAEWYVDELQNKAITALRAALESDDTEMLLRQHRFEIGRLRAALAEPVEPVAWMHNDIEGNVIAHRPSDIDRHPERWTALYSEPKPCPTCEALARTVMLDQTSHDTAPPQRKPLSVDEIKALHKKVWSYCDMTTPDYDFARAIEAAHGIGDSNE